MDVVEEVMQRVVVKEARWDGGRWSQFGYFWSLKFTKSTEGHCWFLVSLKDWADLRGLGFVQFLCFLKDSYVVVIFKCPVLGLGNYYDLYAWVGWPGLATCHICPQYISIYKAILGLIPAHVWALSAVAYPFHSQDQLLLPVTFARTELGKKAPSPRLETEFISLSTKLQVKTKPNRKKS